MTNTKECYDFGDKKVCKICGCENGSCKCETVEVNESKKHV